MACKKSEHEIVREVWSKGSTSDYAFIPFLRLPTNEAGQVRMAYYVEGSVQLQVRRAWRYSNDGVTWTTPAAYGYIFVGTNVWNWGSSYYVPYTNYRWVELGVFGKNLSGTTTESGRVRAKITIREDQLSSFGVTPTAWGILELGLTRAADENRYVYSGANSPYGDVYESASINWSLSVVARTVGSPSGPAAWGAEPYWIGYDDATGAWGVYTGAGVVSGTTLVGSEHAAARVSVDGSGLATFAVSFDGNTWRTLGTQAGPWYWRTYVVQDLTQYTVLREHRS